MSQKSLIEQFSDGVNTLIASLDGHQQEAMTAVVADAQAVYTGAKNAKEAAMTAHAAAIAADRTAFEVDLNAATAEMQGLVDYLASNTNATAIDGMNEIVDHFNNISNVISGDYVQFGTDNTNALDQLKLEIGTAAEMQAYLDAQLGVGWDAA